MEGTASGDYRVAHRTIIVFFAAMWGRIGAMYYKFEHGAEMKVTNARAAASDATGTPYIATALASDPTRASAPALSAATTLSFPPDALSRVQHTVSAAVSPPPKIRIAASTVGVRPGASPAVKILGGAGVTEGADAGRQS